VTRAEFRAKVTALLRRAARNDWLAAGEAWLAYGRRLFAEAQAADQQESQRKEHP
jgi:hypothetical protein